MAAAIAAIAEELPAALVGRLASVLESMDGPEAAGLARARRLSPADRYQARLKAMCSAWTELGTVTGSGIALAIRSASTAARPDDRTSLQLVWTGPATNRIAVRQTHAVLADLIDRAQRRLLLVSFAAFKHADLSERLGSAIGRGVEIRLVLELSKDEGGGLATYGAAHAFASIAKDVRMFHWSADHRPQGASMHAKVAVEDTARALVGSANLTGHAVSKNMEMGVLIEGGPTPRNLVGHFDDLVESGVLEER